MKNYLKENSYHLRGVSPVGYNTGYGEGKGSGSRYSSQHGYGLGDGDLHRKFFQHRKKIFRL